MSSPVIKLKRGAYADLPTLGVGEPGFTTDRYQLYVGSPDGNKLIGGGEFWNLNSTTSGGGIKLYEASNNGTNYVELKSPDLLGANLSLNLPSADGAADQVLKTDGSGNLTFAAVDSLSNAGLNNVVEDTSPQLGGNLDLNSSGIVGTGDINHTGSLQSSGDASLKGGVAVVSSAGVAVSGTLTATTLSGSLPTTDLTGTITNAQLAGSIDDSKLNQISTADKVSLVALDINGATDIGADIVDADIFIIDDGGGGANKKTAASRLKSYVLGGGGSGATFNSITVGSGVTVDTNGIDAPTGIVTASSFVGNLTGNVTGNVTGDLTGDVTGDVTGDLTGNVTGDVTGDVTGTADKADTVGFTPELSSSTPHFVTFATSASYASLKRDTGITYQPSTNTLTAGAFSGPLTGNVTGNVTGNLTGTVQTASQTNITSVGTLGSLAVTNNITVGGTVDGRDIASDGTSQDNLQTLTGVSAGSTTLGTFTGTTISDNKNVKGAIQELETQLDIIAAGGAQASSISVGATDTDASFFPTFVSDNNTDPTQEVLKTDAGISYNPNSNVLTVTSLAAGGAITAAGDVTANGNIVGDNATNITGINQVTASTFVGALTGISTGATRPLVSDHSSSSDTHYIALVEGAGYSQIEHDNGFSYIPSTDTLTVVNTEVSGYIRFDGAGVQVDGFVDEDNMSSNSATKLPTQQSVKAYVDTEVGNITSTITLNGDSTAGIVTTGNTLSIDGTANEIETAVVSDTFTIGLPNEVVVGTSVTAPTLYTSTVKAADGTACFTIANSTGKITTTDGVEIQGASTLQAVDIQGNVTLGDQSSDTVGFGGRVSTDIVPSADSTSQLGSNSLRWSNVYSDNFIGSQVNVSGAATVGALNGTSMTLTGGGNFGGSVQISGNLSVGGSITSVNLEDLKVVSPLIEVGLEDVGDGTSQPPSEQTQYNNGIAMWYNSVGVSSANAKAASVFASVKPGGSFRIGFATDVSFPGSATTEGVGTVNAWAGIEAKELWINDCAGQSQVISCTGSERFLNNITVDGGSFS